MLKPITEQEKLAFTMQLNAERAAHELLATLYYDEKYEGYVDIWPTVALKKLPFSKQRIKLQIGSKKVLTVTSLSPIPMRHDIMCAKQRVSRKSLLIPKQSCRLHPWYDPSADSWRNYNIHRTGIWCC